MNKKPQIKIALTDIDIASMDSIAIVNEYVDIPNVVVRPYYGPNAPLVKTRFKILKKFKFTIRYDEIGKPNSYINALAVLAMYEQDNYTVVIAVPPNPLLSIPFIPLEPGNCMNSRNKFIQAVFNKAEQSATQWLILKSRWLILKSRPGAAETEKPAEPTPERHIANRVSMVGVMMAVYFADFPVRFELKCAREYCDNTELAKGMRKYSDIICSANQATGMVIHTFGQTYVVYDTIQGRAIRLGYVSGCSINDIFHIMEMVVTNHVLTVVDEDE